MNIYISASKERLSRVLLGEIAYSSGWMCRWVVCKAEGQGWGKARSWRVIGGSGEGMTSRGGIVRVISVEESRIARLVFSDWV